MYIRRFFMKIIFGMKWITTLKTCAQTLLFDAPKILSKIGIFQQQKWFNLSFKQLFAEFSDAYIIYLCLRGCFPVPLFSKQGASYYAIQLLLNNKTTLWQIPTWMQNNNKTVRHGVGVHCLDSQQTPSLV